MANSRHRTKRESGATLVEMAVVMPILLLVFIAILESGVAFRDHLAVNQSAKDGVRIAALAGDEPNADCAVLSGVGSFLAGQLTDIVHVQIYVANTDGTQNSGWTNTYTYTSGTNNPLPHCPDWTNGGLGLAPTARQVTAGGGQPLDIVGVRVRMNRSWITGFPPFNGSYVVDEHTILRMEPEAFA